ncbi:MAG: S-adenosylmethionine-dependent methyltransferase [Claussenomyces sp. TS43310]|nr:MAG: S-adenosylmethionine-dependent methyltransferase [Claussenomyces sp. TS43310]
MLPTPDTSHVAFERIYEPAEDSYLFLDTLSSNAETAFLTERFGSHGDCGKEGKPAPMVVEVGTGSGVILAFVSAHAHLIFGRADVVALGVDVNRHACHATQQTVETAAEEQAREGNSHGHYLGNVTADLTTSLRGNIVDVLIFNPPYVPTTELPSLPEVTDDMEDDEGRPKKSDWDVDCHLLALSYAGGADGMETASRLIDMLPRVLSCRGVAYILFCAQNNPNLIKERIKAWGPGWDLQTVGTSGKTAGWEKLVIVRIARVIPKDE